MQEHLSVPGFSVGGGMDGECSEMSRIETRDPSLALRMTNRAFGGLMRE